MTEPTNDGAQAPRYTHRGAGPTGHKIDRDGERFCSIIFGIGQDSDALAAEIVAALNGEAAAGLQDLRELGTVLAALRYWQREGLMSGGAEHDIATDGDSFAALTAEEIDALCERLNVEEA
jgi:hypothetical protein